MERSEKERKKATMLAWLSSLSFQAPYDQRREEHLEGTGSWLLNSDIYQEWKTSAKV